MKKITKKPFLFEIAVSDFASRKKKKRKESSFFFFFLQRLFLEIFLSLDSQARFPFSFSCSSAKSLFRKWEETEFSRQKKLREISSLRKIIF